MSISSVSSSSTDMYPTTQPTTDTTNDTSAVDNSEQSDYNDWAAQFDKDCCNEGMDEVKEGQQEQKKLQAQFNQDNGVI